MPSQSREHEYLPGLQRAAWSDDFADRMIGDHHPTESAAVLAIWLVSAHTAEVGETILAQTSVSIVRRSQLYQPYSK